ncbi:MAG: hypothetical protein WA749_03440 [Gelidibacter sp.]
MDTSIFIGVLHWAFVCEAVSMSYCIRELSKTVKPMMQGNLLVFFDFMVYSHSS